MIVNATSQGWEVIFQRAHEQLALQLACHWHPTYRPQRWTEVLAAIGDHDNEQEGWHGKFHINQAGAPIDFTQKPLQLKQIEQVVQEAAYKSRYVAVLISLHTQYLYSEAAGKNQALAAILERQAHLRNQWLRQLKISKNEAAAAYRLVHWCDRCSLILCRRQLPEDQRKLDIFQGPEEKMYQIWQRADQSLAVEPWPFKEEELSVRVEARHLRQLQFKNDEALARALEEAPVKEKNWLIRQT